MVTNYPFDILRAVDPTEDSTEILSSRPFVPKKDETDEAKDTRRRFKKDAAHYLPGPGLRTAINTAIALGQPLLLTGAPGTGKSSAAYFIARQLNLEPVSHFSVRSASQAMDLAGTYNAVGYMGAELRAQRVDQEVPSRDVFFTPGPLYTAFKSGKPSVVLIDEIDKAPRDFPNDLLDVLDQWKIDFPEVPEIKSVVAKDAVRPIVVITSNAERTLPDAFLRRCVYWHIEMNAEKVREIIAKRVEAKQIDLPDNVWHDAVELHNSMVGNGLDKDPSVSELMGWLQALAVRGTKELTEQDKDIAVVTHYKTPHDQMNFRNGRKD
ncbi:MAG: MoxR family ATPase [Pseudomonadota bacterium]